MFKRKYIALKNYQGMKKNLLFVMITARNKWGGSSGRIELFYKYWVNARLTRLLYHLQIQHFQYIFPLWFISIYLVLSWMYKTVRPSVLQLDMQDQTLHHSHQRLAFQAIWCLHFKGFEKFFFLKTKPHRIFDVFSRFSSVIWNVAGEMGHYSPSSGTFHSRPEFHTKSV